MLLYSVQISVPVEKKNSVVLLFKRVRPFFLRNWPKLVVVVIAAATAAVVIVMIILVENSRLLKRSNDKTVQGICTAS